jgi:DNA replication protein DnaC
MKAAKFPIVKTLDSFDFALIPDLPKAKVLNLAESGYVQHKENILCLGPSGTGKTHVATALGMSAIEKGYRVRFIRTVTLAQELLQAQKEVCLNKYLKSWHKMDLVILDELGYIELGPGAPLVFQFVADRYENGSMIVTSNLDFSRWEEIFGNAALTTALLDRLTHRSHILLFRGESHRFRESRLRLEESETGILEHLSKGRGSG